MTAHTNSAAMTKPRGHRNLVRGFVATAAIAAFVGGMGATASAAGTDVTVDVGSSLTLSGQTTDFTLTGLSGATITGVGAVLYNVETNNLAGYAVTVTPSAGIIDGVAVANLDSIPIGALSFRETGATPWTVKTLAAQTIHTQGTRSAEGGDALSDDYQIVIPFVNQDTYTVTLNYVATPL